MIEVEVKLPVQDIEQIRQKLQKAGFEETGRIYERDTYFDNAGHEIRNADTALRIRETENHVTGERSAQMNYKGKKMDSQTMTRKELESGVEDPEVCRQILQALGFQAVMPEVIKERRTMRRENVEACLDEVQGLGSFLELEIMTAEEKEKDILLKKIENILHYLGYTVADTVRTSYLSMLQKKYGNISGTEE